ncbi:YdeI/OmpD-associated family protein [Dyadobacter sp.]|uniref:YdeI/OmpD-associated family protein n=1 Tax=Dyadobacter sp. TaxID=1914288 RepID=UPI003F718FB8
MNHTDPRIDAYIVKSAPFAIPILEYLRSLVHAACLDVKETMKWSFPHFEYKGSILCSMASFKQHCAFSFWLAPHLSDPHKLLAAEGERTSMGHLGRITSLESLPNEEYLIGFIAEAMELIDKGVRIKNAGGVAKEKKELVIPDYLLEALEENPQARTHFNAFSQSGKREYVTWLEEAKTETTRQRRVETAIEWIQEGKSRNWKYERK